jgi:hypothetical protein
MTKTPYEIRYDLLNYAMSQLTGEYFAAMERIRDTTEPNSPNRISAMNKLKYPTKSDIILLAEELKTFIEKK